MRQLLRAILASICWIGLAAGAVAQDSLNAFGGYPTGTGTGWPYATYGPGTNYTTTTTYAYGPSALYRAPAMPGVTTYYSGYSGAYAPTYSYPAGYTYPSARYWSAAYPTYGYTTYSSYPVYRYRRGLFGLRGW